MKTIRIPALLHEVLGEESTLVELLLIAGVSGGLSLALFGFTQPEWTGLAWWKSGLLLILVFDIIAGLIANLTLGTNTFYRNSPRARLTFIALHVQPLVLALLLGAHLALCAAVWGYTATSGLIVNRLLGYPAQRAVAGSLVVVGLIGLLIGAEGLPLVLVAALACYQLKVIYSFAVDHYAPRTR